MVADAVGLGKTFIGLRLLDHYLIEDKRPGYVPRALVICPAQLRDLVWLKKLDEFGIKATVVSQEELGRKAFDVRQYSRYDMVVVDESHNFRNSGTNHYQNLQRLLGSGKRNKRIVQLLREKLDVARRICAEDPSSEHLKLIDEIQFQMREVINSYEECRHKASHFAGLLSSSKGQRKLDAIELTKTFTSRRVEKLRNWVMANEPNEQDDRDLLQYLKACPAHYNAGNFKRLQNIKLFRVLRLGKLATAQSDEVKPDVDAFFVGSTTISNLYREFLDRPELLRLFPMLSSQHEFFVTVKACLSYLGYQQGGKSIRVETEEAHPNGTDHKGNQRFSKSQSKYFVFWLLMECSGSAFFQQHFKVIIDSIRGRLAAEREARQKWREEKERAESPPRWECAA